MRTKFFVLSLLVFGTVPLCVQASVEPTPLNAADRVTPNTSQPGFIWNVHQADVEGTLPNSNARTEEQLAGLHGDNIADPLMQGPAAGPADAANPSTAPISFVVPGVINFSQFEGNADGNITPDLAMPGIPGLLGGTDNIAAEVLTVIDFPAAGVYTLIVNSDDGFKTTFGRNPRDAFSVVAGEFNGGRGAADTAFDVSVPEAGAYPMRTSWQEGGGGANIEILSMVGGEKVLLNDTDTNPQALRTYRLDSSALSAYVRYVSPGIGVRMVGRPTFIEAAIVDGATTVTTASATLKLNGAEIPVTSTKVDGVTTVRHDIVGELLSATDYTVELSYTDSAGTRTESWTFTTGPFGSTVFVVEAEDFDYSEDFVTGGLSNPQEGVEGMDVNVMPYFGGAYQDLSAVEGIDFVNNDGFDSDQYRTEVGDDGDHEVNIANNQGGAPGNGSGGTIPIAGNDRITYQTTANYRIGWVEGGSWQNYTRTFPTNSQNGWWKVFAALSHADSAMAASLDLVVSGVGTPDQDVERLGGFSAPASGGWGNNNLVVMTDAAGNEAAVKLVGTQTIRFNLGSGDFDFLIFTPTAPPPPFVSVIPEDSVEPTTAVLDFALQDTDSQVNVSTVRIFVDGQDVTSSATIAKDGGVTSIHLDMTGTTLQAGERTWRITFSDTINPTQTHASEGTFVVVPFAIPGIFVVEAEDFNYSEDFVTGGLTNPQKGVEGMDVDVMPYLGGAYLDLSAIEGIDFVNNDGFDSDQYRTEIGEDGDHEVNITASNGNRYSNTRGAFDVESNYRIGWVGGGDWQNYTRTFPSNSYNVWAALSHGNRGAGLLTGSLDLVTSDPAQPDQTVQRLGSFNAPGTGGWGRNELVIMKDTSGQPAVIQLGGVQTVRFNLGSGDFDYLLFVPTSEPTDQPRFTSVIRNANGSITVEWTGGGTLEAAESLSGPWAPVNGATSPYTFTPAANQPMLFARIRQ